MPIASRPHSVPLKAFPDKGLTCLITSLLLPFAALAGASPERFSEEATNPTAPGIAVLQTAITENTVAQSARAFSVSRNGPNRIACEGTKNHQRHLRPHAI